MAVKRCEANIDVVKAAEIRIKNVFGNGLPVFFSFSGGKDSLCVAQLMVNLANRGEIDMKQLTVQFIDEEAIFPCMEDMTKKWRRIFMMMGAKFEWYCVEVKHFNCFNELSNDETFICWDSAKQDVWVRQPPSFAIRNHKLLRPRIDAYQDFLPRTTVSGITMVGIRTAESVQRLQNIASMTKAGNKMTAKKQVFPIYDWTDNDVWLFLLRNHVDIPEIYLFLWQSGSSKRQMRVSQFFSVDTARSLAIADANGKKMYAEVARRLIPCIWNGTEIPHDYVNRAVLKASNPLTYKDRKNWERVLTLACSLVKKDRKMEEWNVALDKNQKDRNYLYGRLLAVADRIEYRTYDDGDKARVTNAKRYMSTFSQRPFETWKVIEENIQPYMNKLGIAERRFYENLLNDIYELFEIDSFKDNKKLDGLYLLGFHSQAYDLKLKKEDSKEKEEEE